MGIAVSLKALGINTDDARSVAEGLNRLIVTKEQKLKLLQEYAVERGIVISKEIEAIIHE
ncbi:MAG: hypothetical protein AAB706_04275 [Patescibacteria group bacterium]